MKNANSVKTALLFVLALAACASEDKRSLVVVDLQLPAGMPAPASVHLVVRNASGGVVRQVDVDWKNPASNVLQVGLYLPEGVTGPLTIVAQVIVGEQVLEGTISVPALNTGGRVSAGTLALHPVVSAGYDGGVDVGPTDVLPSGTGPIDVMGPDGGVAEAGAFDGPGLDGALEGPDAIPVLPDAPLDLPDVPLPPPDGSAEGPATPPLDAAEAIDAAHVPNWEPAQNIENDSINPSYGPTIGMDPINENVYAAWTETGAVKVKRWTRTTGVWEKTVVVENRGRPQEADIGVDGTGHVILVWCQDPNTTDANLMGAWSSQSTDGVAWSPPVRIATPGAYNIRLAVARNGTAHTVYQKKDPTIQWPLFTAYYDGTAWSEAPQYIDTVYGQAPYDPLPLLVVNAEGDGILIYDRWAESGDERIGAVTLTGATFSAPETMNANNETIPYDDRTIAMNRKGEAIFVWAEGIDYQASLYARTYSPSLGWSSPSPAITSASNLSPMAAALDEQGNATIVWQQNLASGKANLMGVHGSTTAGWSDVALIETDNQATYYTYQNADPKMAADENGNVFIAWRKDSSSGDVKTYGAYGSHFSIATKTWSPQIQLGQITGLNVVEVSLAISDQGLGVVDFTYMSENSTTEPDAYNTMVSFYR